jgi:hypothetical protein
MTYTILAVQFSESTGKVLSMDWSYTTEYGVLSSTHVFDTPAGDLPADGITEAVLIGWLKAQSSQSEEDMAASLRAEHERQVAAASVRSLSLNGHSLAAALEEQKRVEKELRLAYERMLAEQAEQAEQAFCPHYPYERIGKDIYARTKAHPEVVSLEGGQVKRNGDGIPASAMTELGLHLPIWEDGVTYEPGTVVIHKGMRYLKLDDKDNSPPDNIPGGWEPL